MGSILLRETAGESLGAGLRGLVGLKNGWPRELTRILHRGMGREAGILWWLKHVLRQALVRASDALSVNQGKNRVGFNLLLFQTLTTSPRARCL